MFFYRKIKHIKYVLNNYGFTARRVCIARTMPWQDVRLFVRLSVCLTVCNTPVLCLNDYTYPQRFHRRVA